MTTATLREAEHGEKNRIIRELLDAHPDLSTIDLAKRLPEEFKERGLIETREYRKLYQAVINEKKAVKLRKEKEAARAAHRKVEPQDEEVIAAIATPEPLTPAPQNHANATHASNGHAVTRANGFTVADLQTLAEMARRFGGYGQLQRLVGFLGENAR